MILSGYHLSFLASWCTKINPWLLHPEAWQKNNLILQGFLRCSSYAPLLWAITQFFWKIACEHLTPWTTRVLLSGLSILSKYLHTLGHVGSKGFLSSQYSLSVTPGSSTPNDDGQKCPGSTAGKGPAPRVPFQCSASNHGVNFLPHTWVL